MSRRTVMALYPNLQSHRIELGWEVSDIIAKLAPAGKLSASSVYRLEGGREIRASNVSRVFNLINAERKLKGLTELDGSIEMEIVR